MHDLRTAALEVDAVTASVLESVARDTDVEPTAMIFLLRRYAATGADDLRDVLGRALAVTLDRAPDAGTIAALSARLTAFTEALALSDDERLKRAAARLATDLERAGRQSRIVEDVMLAIETTLGTADANTAPIVVPPAIDQLERVVGYAYRPGEGMAHLVDKPDGERGRLGDQIRSASALLTAYEATGRLPYAMLAEELMQTALRESRDGHDGAFVDGPAGSAAKPLALNADAARVLCRLAALHRDDEYRRAAVLASDADYARDAARVLAYLSSAGCARGACAAVYGLALAQWVALHYSS